MKTKFKPGEKAIFQGNEVVISVASKNMATKQMSYLLVDGRKVSEEDLSKLVSDKPAPNKGNAEIIALREKYEAVFGKEVAPVKKNDKAWIAKKIKEYTPVVPKAPTAEEIVAKQEEEEAKAKYLAVSVLNREQLVALIAEKELEIAEEDYEETDDLVVAICEELEIAIPE